MTQIAMTDAPPARDPADRIRDLEAKVARLQRVEAEYGRLDIAIVMADPDFDGNSPHASAADRLIASVNRLAAAARRAGTEGAGSSTAVDGPQAVENADHQDIPADHGVITMINRNWRGVVSLRRISATGVTVWHGATSWHPTPGPLLRAFDLDKQAWRDFALEDCAFLFTERPNLSGPQDAPEALRATGSDGAAGSARSMRLALEAIAKATPSFDYVAASKCGLDLSRPGSPYDRGKAAAYAELQAVAQSALKYL